MGNNGCDGSQASRPWAIGSGYRFSNGGVWVAELGHLGYHQGVEKPAFPCRAPPEGRGDPGSTPGGMGGPGGPSTVPPGRDFRGMARPGAGVAGFPGGGGGAPRPGREGHCLAAPDPARRPRPLAQPPEEPAAAAAPAPTQTGTQATARPKGNGSRPGRPSLRPLTVNTAGWVQTDGPECPLRQALASRPRAPPPQAVRAAGHVGERRNRGSWRPRRLRAHRQRRRQVGARRRHATHGHARQWNPSDPLTTDH